jgi:uncharacterized phosphosugar-binding protein
MSEEDVEMISMQFNRSLQDVLDKVVKTQQDQLDKVSVWAAESIAANRFALVFGTGHSFLAVYDTFPRIGSYPGWLPIHELSSSYMTSLVGNQSIRQVLFLENLEGFGRVVLENYRIDPQDIMIIISHSGVHAMAIDIALAAKENGLKTVAITSVAQSKMGKTSHSCGKRLFEVCDAVIDTCVPPGDAVVEVLGLPHKVGAISTIVACSIMQILVSETAQKLLENGEQLIQMARDRKMIDASIAEQVRRTMGLYK